MLPVVLRTADDLTLSIFGNEGWLAFAIALRVVLASFFSWLAFPVEKVVLICTLGALRLVVDQVIA